MEELQLVSDPVLRRDLEEIADSDMISWERFREKTILVTGATGLIGSQTVLALVLAGQKRKLNLTVLALVRNLEKAEKMLGGCLGKGLKLVKGDVTESVPASVLQLHPDCTLIADEAAARKFVCGEG